MTVFLMNTFMARVVGDADRVTVANWKVSLLKELRLKGYTFIHVDLFLGKNKLDDNRHLVYYNLTNGSCVEVVPTAGATGDLGDPQAGCVSLVGKRVGEWMQARRS